MRLLEEAAANIFSILVVLLVFILLPSDLDLLKDHPLELREGPVTPAKNPC